ncbi:MAG: tetratricopeptide repeat protein [bacterium]|nr:tetratricopeptide repeat protein [bacterium]
MFNSGLESFIWAHLLQFTIGILLVGLIVRVAGRRWPHATFLLCMLALAKCLVPPVITSPAGLFTRYESVAFSPEVSEVSPTDLVRWKQQERITPASSTNAAGLAPGGWLARLTDLVSRVLDSQRLGFPVLVLVWCLGMLAIMLRASQHWFQLRRMVAATKPAPERIHWMCCEVKHQLGVRRDVSVSISEDNYGPACVGFFQVKLVIPAILASRFPDRLLRPIIAHELVHARRGDIFWGYLQFIAQVVWWFHPMVWWLGRRASDLCERCCDDEVVSSSQCVPGDYAESLVRVLELKSSLRTMPLAQAMSPIQITRLRLEAIMKKCGSYSKQTAIASWLLAGSLGILLIPGMRWVVAHENETKPVHRQLILSEQQAKMVVNRAIQAGDWDQVIRILQPVVEREPENPGALFYLGYALHVQGRYQSALEYHRRAAEFEGTRSLALYNWSCSLALLERHDEALSKLEQALDEGFLARYDLAEDSDFQSLLKDERFQELRSRQKTYRQLDFLAGDWTLQDATGSVLSTHQIHIAENGHLLREQWQEPDGASGTSIYFLHPEDGTWRQTRIQNDGSVAEYVAHGDATGLSLSGQQCLASGESQLQRIHLQPGSQGILEYHRQHSLDGGQTWKAQPGLRWIRDDSQAVPIDSNHRERIAKISPIGLKLE